MSDGEEGSGAHEGGGSGGGDDEHAVEQVMGGDDEDGEDGGAVAAHASPRAPSNWKKLSAVVAFRPFSVPNEF